MSNLYKLPFTQTMIVHLSPDKKGCAFVHNLLFLPADVRMTTYLNLNGEEVIA